MSIYKYKIILSELTINMDSILNFQWPSDGITHEFIKSSKPFKLDGLNWQCPGIWLKDLSINESYPIVSSMTFLTQAIHEMKQMYYKHWFDHSGGVCIVLDDVTVHIRMVNTTGYKRLYALIRPGVQIHLC